MIYVKRLQLKNIKCFENLELNFEKRGQTALILGDNGVGKSTIIRSLALGLCDESSASALFRELPGDFVRESKNKKSGQIVVDLESGAGYSHRITTTINVLGNLEGIKQTLSVLRGGKRKRLKQHEFPWSKMFISGYGPGIRSMGSADFSSYRTVDAVYSLFRYDEPLQNPELVIRRLFDAIRIYTGAKIIIRKVSRRGQTYFVPNVYARNKKERLKVLELIKGLQKLLADVLNLTNGRQIGIGLRGIEIAGPWGIQPLSSLGDGYRATVTWILDLISWWLLNQDIRNPIKKLLQKFSAISGIVFVDELEQHLHPQLQKTILGKLHQLFPNVQFIVTSHSPLIASSSKGIGVWRIFDGLLHREYPYGWLAEDVYEVMGIDSSRSQRFINDILDVYEILDEKRLRGKLSTKEKKIFKQLKIKLSILPNDDPIRVITEISNIKKRAEEVIRNSKN